MAKSGNRRNRGKQAGGKSPATVFGATNVFSRKSPNTSGTNTGDEGDNVNRRDSQKKDTSPSKLTERTTNVTSSRTARKSSPSTLKATMYEFCPSCKRTHPTGECGRIPSDDSSVSTVDDHQDSGDRDRSKRTVMVGGVLTWVPSPPRGKGSSEEEDKKPAAKKTRTASPAVDGLTVSNDGRDESMATNPIVSQKDIDPLGYNKYLYHAKRNVFLHDRTLESNTSSTSRAAFQSPDKGNTPGSTTSRDSRMSEVVRNIATPDDTRGNFQSPGVSSATKTQDQETPTRANVDGTSFLNEMSFMSPDSKRNQTDTTQEGETLQSVLRQGLSRSEDSTEAAQVNPMQSRPVPIDTTRVSQIDESVTGDEFEGLTRVDMEDVPGRPFTAGAMGIDACTPLDNDPEVNFFGNGSMVEETETMFRQRLTGAAIPEDAQEDGHEAVSGPGCDLRVQPTFQPHVPRFLSRRALLSTVF